MQLDIPAPNAAAQAPFGGARAPVFQTARMYTGTAPLPQRLYGVTSFELARHGRRAGRRQAVRLPHHQPARAESTHVRPTEAFDLLIEAAPSTARVRRASTTWACAPAASPP